MPDPFHEELKVLLVEALNLRDTKPSDIGDDTPLLGDGLNLDSLDALELILAIEKRYHVKITSSEDSKKALESVRVLAGFIRARQTS